MNLIFANQKPRHKKPQRCVDTWKIKAYSTIKKFVRMHISNGQCQDRQNGNFLKCMSASQQDHALLAAL
jgi:hypothetical protein